MESSRKETCLDDLFYDLWAGLGDADRLEGGEEMGLKAGVLDSGVEGGVCDHDIVVRLVNRSVSVRSNFDAEVLLLSWGRREHVPTYIRVFTTPAQHCFQTATKVSPWFVLAVIFYPTRPV